MTTRLSGIHLRPSPDEFPAPTLCARAHEAGRFLFGGSENRPHPGGPGGKPNGREPLGVRLFSSDTITVYLQPRHRRATTFKQRGAVKFSRTWAMPSPNTLSIPPIREFALRHLAGRSVVIDPFAKDNRLGTLRNDLDPDTAAECHMEAEAFLAKLAQDGIKAQAAIVDPPYSPRQMAECYGKVGLKKGMGGTQNAALYKRTRDGLMPLLTPDAVVLSFGWNSAGMGLKRGFEIIELLLVAHGGGHNDTICVAERQIPAVAIEEFEL